MRCRRSPIKLFVCVLVSPFLYPFYILLITKQWYAMHHNASKVSALLHIILIDAMKAVMFGRVVNKL